MRGVYVGQRLGKIPCPVIAQFDPMPSRWGCGALAPPVCVCVYVCASCVCLFVQSSHACAVTTRTFPAAKWDAAESPVPPTTQLSETDCPGHARARGCPRKCRRGLTQNGSRGGSLVACCGPCLPPPSSLFFFRSSLLFVTCQLVPLPLPPSPFLPPPTLHSTTQSSQFTLEPGGPVEDLLPLPSGPSLKTPLWSWVRSGCVPHPGPAGDL